MKMDASLGDIEWEQDVNIHLALRIEVCLYVLIGSSMLYILYCTLHS